MSRQHMLYDNRKLSSIPVKVLNWDASFDSKVVFKEQNGPGIIVEGSVVARSRFLIVDGLDKSLKHHFTLLHLDATRAWLRRFDAEGKEIEPDKSTGKKVNTGYLMSSYKNVQKEGMDEVALKDLPGKIKVDFLEALSRDKVSSLCGSHLITIWAKETTLEGSDLAEGSKVRLRTKGSGPLLESFVELDEETKNLASYSTGEHVGTSWTDKVMGLKDKEVVGQVSQKEGEGADDDEWDD